MARDRTDFNFLKDVLKYHEAMLLQRMERPLANVGVKMLLELHWSTAIHITHQLLGYDRTS